MMIQNGPEPFVHPVSGIRILPYEYYQGAAHLDHENKEEVNEEAKPKGRRIKKEEE